MKKYYNYIIIKAHDIIINAWGFMLTDGLTRSLNDSLGEYDMWLLVIIGKILSDSEFHILLLKLLKQ